MIDSMMPATIPPPAAVLLARRLERLKNRATRYEIAAVNKETGRKILVMYGQTSRSSILRGLTQNPNGRGETRLDLLTRATGTAAGSWWTDRAGIRSGPWEIKVTGRTQREAYTTGELEETIYDREAVATKAEGEGQ